MKTKIAKLDQMPLVRKLGLNSQAPVTLELATRGGFGKKIPHYRVSRIFLYYFIFGKALVKLTKRLRKFFDLSGALELKTFMLTRIFFEIILLKFFVDFSFDRKSIIGSVEVL